MKKIKIWIEICKETAFFELILGYALGWFFSAVNRKSNEIELILNLFAVVVLVLLLTALILEMIYKYKSDKLYEEFKNGFYRNNKPL